MSKDEIFLEDLIEELVGFDKVTRLSVHIKKWTNNFKTLKELTITVNLDGENEILVIDKKKFIKELKRLSEVSEIKSNYIKFCN